eukprot:90046_1
MTDQECSPEYDFYERLCPEPYHITQERLKYKNEPINIIRSYFGNNAVNNLTEEKIRQKYSDEKMHEAHYYDDPDYDQDRKDYFRMHRTEIKSKTILNGYYRNHLPVQVNIKPFVNISNTY